MLERIKSLKMNNYAIVSILFILIGVYGGIGANFLGFKLPLGWTWLIIGGTLALYSQFGTEVLKISLGKMKGKNLIFVIIAVVIVSYILAFGSVIIGDMLGQKSAANGALGTGTKSEKIMKLITVLISLIGEEIITAAIAFPVFYICAKKMGTRNAWIIAVLVSCILFGLMHWKAYNGNMYQMLVVIGLARVPFTWAWTKTESLWGGIITHVIYDLLLFIPMIATTA